MPITFNSKVGKYGLPFFIFVISGWIGLSEFTKLRYKYRNQTRVGKREQIMLSLEGGNKMTLEGEYERVKKMNLDNWENKRIPRPWEPQENKDQQK